MRSQISHAWSRYHAWGGPSVFFPLLFVYMTQASAVDFVLDCFMKRSIPNPLLVAFGNVCRIFVSSFNDSFDLHLKNVWMNSFFFIIEFVFQTLIWHESAKKCGRVFLKWDPRGKMKGWHFIYRWASEFSAQPYVPMPKCPPPYGENIVFQWAHRWGCEGVGYGVFVLDWLVEYWFRGCAPVFLLDFFADWCIYTILLGMFWQPVEWNHTVQWSNNKRFLGLY